MSSQPRSPSSPLEEGPPDPIPPTTLIPLSLLQPSVIGYRPLADLEARALKFPVENTDDIIGANLSKILLAQFSDALRRTHPQYSATFPSLRITAIVCCLGQRFRLPASAAYNAMALPTTTSEYTLGKIGDYHTLGTREADIPPLEDGQVLVKVHAVSLQYRDLAIARGTYGVTQAPDGLVPCSDASGTIVVLTPSASSLDWNLGDRVAANFCNDHLYGDATPEVLRSALGSGDKYGGALVGYRSFPAHALVKIPDFLSYEEACTLPCAGVTAYNALHGPIPLKAGDYVLILGTGGVAIFGLQFALASGATVIVTSSSNDKLGAVRKLGAHHVINYKTNENWDEEVLKITNGRGVDHVIEVSGSTVLQSIKSVRIGGSIHLVGYVGQGAPPANLIWPIIGKAVNVRGVLIGPVALFKDMLHLIMANPKVAKPVVDKVFPWEEAVQAYEYLEAQKHVGKVVIRVAKD